MQSSGVCPFMSVLSASTNGAARLVHGRDVLRMIPVAGLLEVDGQPRHVTVS